MAGESSYKVKKYYVVFVGKTDKSTFKISPKAGVKRLNPGGVQPRQSMLWRGLEPKSNLWPRQMVA
jgi:hypothetical protein